MIGTFAFIFGRTMRNMVAHRLRRLKEPRYLIATLGGIAYFYFSFLHRMFRHRQGISVEAPFMHRPGLLPMLELCGCIILGIVLLGAWILPQSPAALKFSEAEVQFLFTAPLPRQSLIHYKLLRTQVALLLGALIASFVMNGRAFSSSAWPFTLGLWLVLLILNLHFLGLGLLRTQLIEFGVSAARRRWVTLGLLAAALAAAAYSVREAVPAVVLASRQGAGDLLKEAARISNTGVPAVLLFPLRIMVRPMLAPSLAAFGRLALPALGILVLNYIWVVRSEAAFEEASAEASEKAARKWDRAKRGERGVHIRAPGKRKPPFALSAAGRPEGAIFWKNLISVGRILNVRILLAVVALVSISAGLGPVMMPHLPGLWGALAAALALFAGAILLFGASMFRADLRQDLVDLELLRVWPMKGWQLVLGELAVPVALLTGIELVCLLALLLMVPRAGITFMDTRTASFGLVGGMILVPAICLGTVLIQNTVVLLFPAWVSLGQERARGLEASGQRVINLAMTLVALSFALIPAALGAAATVLLTWGWMGPVGLIFAGFSASVILLAEGGVGVWALGRLFDDLDAAKAGILKS